jgi:hypothetical protein
LEPRDKHTDLKAAFRYADLVLIKRCVIFVLSDFLDQNFIDPHQNAGRKHDVIAMQVLDKANCNSLKRSAELL